MACTAFPAPNLGLFVDNVQGVWNSVNETKPGGKSCTYTGGTLSINGPNGSPGPITAGANQKVRHKFFGANNFLAVCISETGAGPKSHTVLMVDFTTTPTSTVLLFTTPVDSNPPLPFVQFDTGPGSVCCIGGASGNQVFGLALYRSDNGAVLDSAVPFTPTLEISGEAVAAGVQIKHGGNVIAGPVALPSGSLDVQPNTQSFADVKLGGCPQAPSTKVFKLKNTGSDCLTISGIANAGPFSVTSTSQTLPASLKKNEFVDVTVTFAPTGTGTFDNVALAVTRTPAKGEDKLICSGKAVTAQPAFSVSPGALNFGTVRVGTTSAPKNVTIKNTGDVPIAISVAGSPVNSVFAWPAVATNLTCGAQIVLPVTFSPTVDGPAPGGTIGITATPGSTKTVALGGAGCVPSAKLSAPPAPFPAFGPVRQGYRMPRFAPFANTGDETLSFTATISGPDAALFGLMKPSQSITDVASSLNVVVEPTFSCGGGATGDGVAEVAVVFFANAAPPKVANATLTIDNHNDPSAPASISYALTAEVIAGNVVDAVAVFDTSGSMADPVQGGGSKMQAAIEAGRLLVQLLPPNVGNRIAATRFATTASTFLPIGVVTSASQPGQVNAIANPPLAPLGATAIAAGAMVGMKELAVPHPAGVQPNLTKAVIVLSDGQDNTAFKNPDDGNFYTVLGGPAKDPGNPFGIVITQKFVPPSDVKFYAIGLGTGQDIDKTQLDALSTGSGGHYLPVDPTQPATAFTLMKYYTQIYMDLVDMAVLKDPRDTLQPGQKHVIEFDVLAGDVGLVVVMYDLRGLRLPFWLETPKGEIVDAAFVPAGFALRPGFTGSARYLDVVLPWADGARYAGRWKLVVMHDGRVCKGNPEPKNKELGFRPRDCSEFKRAVEYGYMIGVGSNFRLQAFLNGGTVRVGEPIRMTGVPTEAGLPVRGCIVTVDVVSPGGQVWPGIQLKDDGAHDDGDADDGEYARAFTQTTVPGSYTFTFRARGFTRDGEPVQREVVRAKTVQGWGTEPPAGGGGGGGGDDECCRRLLEQLREQTAILKAIASRKDES
jgi:hypothetical protein